MFAWVGCACAGASIVVALTTACTSTSGSDGAATSHQVVSSGVLGLATKLCPNLSKLSDEETLAGVPEV